MRSHNQCVGQACKELKGAGVCMVQSRPVTHAFALPGTNTVVIGFIPDTGSLGDHVGFVRMESENLVSKGKALWLA